MAFDFVVPKPPAPALPEFSRSDRVLLDNQSGNDGQPDYKSALQWREDIFGLVSDAMLLDETCRGGANEGLWRQEARQRAENFAKLGLLQTSAAFERQECNKAAIATLAGAYRLLAKCQGNQPVQCQHILKKFVTNLWYAYAPVYGTIELDMMLCPVVLHPVKSRGLILCVGMLLQGMIRRCSNTGTALRLNLILSLKNASEYSLVLQFNGRRETLIGSPEFELACRLSGVFQSELSCTDMPDGSVETSLNFPILADCRYVSNAPL